MTRTSRAVLTLIALAAAAAPAPGGQQLPSGEAVMRRVNGRSRGAASRATLEMTLGNRRRTFAKVIVADRQRFGASYRTAYSVTAPDHEAGIGLLLSEDDPGSGMWMYFPAVDQVVRVASRGFPALATDFTCEDLRVGMPLADYEFHTLGRDRLDGVATLRVQMTPRTERLRREVGYSSAIGWIREDNWIVVRASYRDDSGEAFRTFTASDLQWDGAIWTVGRMRMHNHRADHATEVRVRSIDYSFRFGEGRFAADRFGRLFALPPT